MTTFPKHPQALVVDDVLIFAVDEKLQPLIQCYVDHDIVTFNSCQDNVNGTCWIQYGLGDWIMLSELAYQQSKELYEFIEQSCNVSLSCWDNGYQDDADENWIAGDHLIWSASVRFPKELLPDFERLVRAMLATSH